MLTAFQPTSNQWDTFVQRHPRAHPLQLSAWGKLKSAYGWQAECVALGDGTTPVAGTQILYRPLPFRLGSLAYIPFGAYVTDDTQWPALWRAIEKQARSHGAAFLKWEPGFYHDDTPPPLADWGFIESPQTVQPPRTIMLDITGDDDTILSRMNQGTRRKIRKSLKEGIHYYQASADDLTKFTQMMTVTGDRNDFGVHSPDYYRLAYDLFVPDGTATLWLAEHDSDVLAGVMIFALGNTATYLYGASSNIKRNLMASYGIQWQAIQWAREHGHQYYDLWGIPDEDETTLEDQFQDRSDGLWGVYGFKRGWGGDVLRSAGTWDLVYNKLIYSAYKLALKLRS